MSRFTGFQALGIAAILMSCGTDSVPKSDEIDEPFAAEPPAVYVAKVKNILVGLPPTDAEVAAVEADPAALQALVDDWMKLPEYQQKMLVFFQLAFQQTQILPVDFVELIPPNGLLNGASVPLLTQNAAQSFARTVLALQAEGKPLTEAFTTKRIMMTPALMSLYAFLDMRTVDNDGQITDRFRQQNPTLRITMRTAGGPVPIAQSLNPASPNYMTFYTPDLPTLNYPDPTCEGLDPITFTGTSQLFFQMLLGEIPTHPGPNGNCNNRAGSAASVQFAASDFTDWKMVTIRKPATGEAISEFYNFPELRGSAELVLATPRPGFYSTPAFMLNWPTNASNQHRVTLNQALIVATGAQIDGSDATTPSTTPGMDTTHATEECVGCHQLLDPTRSIFSATYSWFGYPQTEAALENEPGQFAFMDVIAPMATIDDFGQQLAMHPLVPEAWAQKLCYYVNSAPCDSSDPELQRIITAFRGSNMSWDTLVRELASSPITTHARVTKTALTNGEVIAVSRRDHLCSAIDSRLGLVDICQLDATLGRAPRKTAIGQIVAGLPSDGYGRGATIPVLPNDPTLFYRSGLENICGSLSQMVVDGMPDPLQPGKQQWSSSDPDAAIGDFTAIVMSLTPRDPRTGPATQALKDHFTAALATGATATDSLRSAFVVACLSPSFLGIGL